MSVSDTARHSAHEVVAETYDELGYNYRMSDLQAAVGLVQLRRLDELLARRRYLAARYSHALVSIDWLFPPVQVAGCRPNYQSYMVRLKRTAPLGRDTVMQTLLGRGISTRRGVMAIHRERPYWEPSRVKSLPETSAAADQTIILPLFHQMTEEDQDYVIECIHDISADTRA
jgi:dTDP-4-amino-4,6-dideoxygalactose transaminase